MTSPRIKWAGDWDARAPTRATRLEEHGLHIWFGFYDKAFQMMQYVYEDCFQKKLLADSPIRTWTDAFQQHNILTAMETVDGHWKP